MCDDRGSATGWEVMVAVRRFQHRLEVFMDQSLEPLALTFAQYRALEAIDTNIEMHISELARLLRLSRQAVQATIAKLDRGGLVDLTRESARIYVATSNEGRRRLAHARRFTLDFKEQLEARLSAAQRSRLTRLLDEADLALRQPHQREWWLDP